MPNPHSREPSLNLHFNRDLPRAFCPRTALTHHPSPFPLDAQDVYAKGFTTGRNARSRDEDPAPSRLRKNPARGRMCCTWATSAATAVHSVVKMAEEKSGGKAGGHRSWRRTGDLHRRRDLRAPTGRSHSLTRR